jgi:hypothetical protein
MTVLPYAHHRQPNLENHDSPSYSRKVIFTRKTNQGNSAYVTTNCAKSRAVMFMSFVKM